MSLLILNCHYFDTCYKLLISSLNVFFFVIQLNKVRQQADMYLVSIIMDKWFSHTE